jgi:trehalose/maltose transport system permease protein
MKKWKLPFIALVILWSVFPFYWALISSFRSGSGLFSTSLFSPPNLENYRAVFTQQPFGRNILNSVLVATSSVALSLLAGLTAAYALARMRFKGRRTLLVAVLGISMFPQIAVLAGLFELIRAMGLYDHWLGLTVSYMTFTLPFTVWVLTSFLREIPRSVEEAALMDGAGRLTILFRIFVPMVAPAMVTTGLLAFIAAWNEFLFAITFTLSDRARTVPVAISQLSGASQHELPWGNIMAASVVVTLPLLALVLVFQRRIVSGLTAGSVKG